MTGVCLTECFKVAVKREARQTHGEVTMMVSTSSKSALYEADFARISFLLERPIAKP